MKKRYLLIISLIISLLFGAYAFFSQKEEKQAANEIFKGCLSEADSCFGVDYTKADEDTKNYYYIKAASNLHTAIYIFEFTSYGNDKNNNPDLAKAISGLYLSMTVQSTPEANNRWIAVTEKRDAIFKSLHYISMNPNDKDNCKELAKIVSDIGY